MGAGYEAYARGATARRVKTDLDLPVSSGVGVTTMFSVLLILCVTVFAVLAFASAQADLRLTKKNAEMVSSYYEADSLAALVSAKASEFWPLGEGRPDATGLKALEEAIRALDGDVAYALAEYEGDGIRVAYSIETGALLTLDVALSLPRPGVCEPLSWRMEAKETTAREQELPVWQGN
ncbi:MAG: hypothetical protein LBG71_05445 [Clostridiales Family XIII bacterium]|jgi:hypothetical protein|nr:hypothetical protein [Clostridiales Family XIII bacterium]